MAFIMTLENGFNDIEIEVIDYDYEPAEPMSWDNPGCPEGVIINKVVLTDTQQEICLLDDEEPSVVEALLEYIHEEQAYNKYGYMMDG